MNVNKERNEYYNVIVVNLLICIDAFPKDVNELYIYIHIYMYIVRKLSI